MVDFARPTYTVILNLLLGLPPCLDTDSVYEALGNVESQHAQIAAQVGVRANET